MARLRLDKSKKPGSYGCAQSLAEGCAVRSGTRIHRARGTATSVGAAVSGITPAKGDLAFINEGDQAVIEMATRWV